MHWFDLRLSDKLYNRFVNIINVININNLISRLRNINLRIKQKKIINRLKLAYIINLLLCEQTKIKILRVSLQINLKFTITN